MSTDEPENFAFSADINQLLSLIINTFYSNKDIFLRELVSNASDAIDKIRYESLTNADALNSDNDLRLEIVCDKENRQLTIKDSGVGMTKADLINNLGTIAKSGTKAFMEAVAAGSDMSLIGQFGVGFYSAYLVADKVTVISKHNDDDQYTWESSAGGSFSVTSVEGLNRGTKIILHLKEDMVEYLEETKLRELIHRHNEFINYPINLWVEKTKELEVTDDEAEENEEEKDDTKTEDDDDKPKVEDVSDDEDTKPAEKKMKKITETYNEWEKINKMQPIWTRKPEDVTHEEYTQFYKNLSNDWEGHSAVKHFSVEGQLEFKSIIFIPKRVPFDLVQGVMNRKPDNIKLYVRRVFIMDNCEELLPEWLQFIKGVVDSEDLPLNISREILQQNKIMKVMKKNIVKKSIELLQELSEDETKYLEFYNGFSKNIKLGVHQDDHNRSKLAGLLRFYTSKSGNNMVSLDQYVERMKESQPGIFYITGPSQQAIDTSPFVEKLLEKDYEVIFMTQAIDEYVVQQLKEYSDKKLICATKEGLDLDTADEKTEFKEAEKQYEKLCTIIKSTLGELVSKVVISNRMVNSPSALVTSQYGWSANMERIMSAQALNHDMMARQMQGQRILELNYKHKIINSMLEKFNENENDTTVKDLIWLMYETSIITSGYSLPRPTEFANRLNKLVELGLGLDIGEDDADQVDETDQVDAASTEETVSTKENTTDDMPSLEADSNDDEESTMEHVD